MEFGACCFHTLAAAAGDQGCALTSVTDMMPVVAEGNSSAGCDVEFIITFFFLK